MSFLSHEGVNLSGFFLQRLYPGGVWADAQRYATQQDALAAMTARPAGGYTWRVVHRAVIQQTVLQRDGDGSA